MLDRKWNLDRIDKNTKLKPNVECSYVALDIDQNQIDNNNNNIIMISLHHFMNQAFKRRAISSVCVSSNRSRWQNIK